MSRIETGIGLSEGMKSAPDRAAKVQSLSRELGLPADVVDRNYDDISRRAATRPEAIQRLQQESPHVAGWLAKPQNAAVAHDEIPHLGTVEWLTSKLHNTYAAGVAALPSLNSSLLSILSIAPDVAASYERALYRIAPPPGQPAPGQLWSERLGSFLRSQGKQTAELADVLRPHEGGAGEQAFYGGVESTAQMLLTLGYSRMMGAGLTTGSAVSAETANLGIMGASAAGQSYGEAREKGVGTFDAAMFAAAQGAVEVATEKLPLAKYLEGIKLKKGALKIIAGQALPELAGEEVATALQDMNEWGVLNPDKTFRDYLSERPAAAASTAIATLTTVGLMGAASSALTRMSGDQAKARLDSLKETREAIAASKTLERSPEALRELIDKVADGKTILLPASTFTEYFQSRDIDPAEAAAALTEDGAAKYQQAAVAGSDFEVPYGDYYSKLAKDHGEFFDKELRLHPEEMNFREHEAAVKELSETAPTEDVPEQSSASKVREDVVGQLINRGFSRDTVEANAKAVEAVFGTLGARAGIDPWELFSRYDLEIQRPLPEILKDKGTLGKLGAMIERLKSGDVPKTRDVKGPSLVEFLKENGGVKDDGTELSRMDVDYGGRRGARYKAINPATGKREDRIIYNLIQNETGRSLDDARLLATEAGYIGAAGEDDSQTTSIDDLLEALRQELGGAPQYSAKESGVKSGALAEDEALTQLADYLEQSGIDLGATKTEDVVRQLEQAAKLPAGGGEEYFQASMNPEEYAGEHRAPGPDDGAPLHEVTPVYPDDVYGPMAARYYGHTGGGDPMDNSSIAIMQRLRGKPDARITVYRAVPDDMNTADKIARIERHKAYILKTGKLPEDANTQLQLYRYYDAIAAELKTLRATDYSAESAAQINPGDWVTINRKYAKEHGESTLRGNYVLLSKSVKASEVFTDGNSIHEWGYWPDASASLRDRGDKKELRGPYRQDDLQSGKPPRGIFSFGEGYKRYIKLLDGANLSTFLHESGHFYLEVVGDLTDELKSRSETAPTETQAALLADYQALLDWMGVKDRKGIQREHHEKFARALEQYYHEGKAPTTELRGLFQRFREWMLGVYKNLTEHRVNLTDEVRGVFDRLHATDAAIKAAKADLEPSPLFVTQQQSGLDDATWQAYQKTMADASMREQEQLFGEELAERQRARTEWWKTEEKKAREESLAHILAQPDQIAVSILRKGVMPDGSESPVGAVKLDQGIVNERYGKATDLTKKLRTLGITRVDGGVDPDTAARVLGFRSGDALVEAVANARNPEKLAIAEARDTMRARHGDMVLDGTVHERARAAVGEHYDEVQRAEMRAVARKQAEVAPFVSAARASIEKERAYERRWLEAEKNLAVAIAEGRKDSEIDAIREEIAKAKRDQAAEARAGRELIDQGLPSRETVRRWAEDSVRATKVKDLNPAKDWASARRASRAAVDALKQAKPDYAKALLAKKQELALLELFRQATAAKEDVRKLEKYARELSQPRRRGRIGLAGEDYLDQLDALLDRYEFKQIPLVAIQRRESLRKWIESKAATGDPINLPDEVLEESRRINYREATVEELNGVRDALKGIEHGARFKNRLLKAKAARELDAVLTEVSDSIQAHKPGPSKISAEPRLPSLLGKGVRGFQQFIAAHTKLASYAEQMDGYQDGGPMWEFVVRPLNEAADDETLRNSKSTEALQELFDLYKGQQRSLYQKTHIPGVGSLSRMGRIMVALNWGTEQGRQRVTDGGRGRVKWNEKQVQAILDSLDETDLKFVNGVWKHVNSYWADIAAKEKRVNGVAPEKVEGEGFDAKAGHFDGGYFPLKYEDRISARAGSHLESEFADSLKAAAYVHATTKRGHLKTRLEHVELPVRLDFSVIFEHIRQVNHDLSHHEALIDVGKVLGSKRVSDAIFDRYGDIAYKEMTAAMRDAAFGKEPAAGWMAAAEHARQGVTIGGLGYNVMTSALQPFQAVNAAAKIGPQWVATGAYRWLRNMATLEGSAKWVNERSDFMKTRDKTQTREMDEIRNQLGVDSGQLKGWIDDTLSHVTDRHVRQGIADSFFWMIGRTQRVADHIVWLGAFEKAMADQKGKVRGVDTLEGRASALADQAVIDTQGSGLLKDLSRVERGNPLLKLWTTFYSYGNLVMQQNRAAFKKTDVLHHPVRAGRLLVDLMLINAIPAVIEELLRDLFQRGLGDDSGTFATNAARSVGSQVLNQFVGVREFGSIFQGGKGARGYEGPTGARLFTSLLKFGQQAAQGETDKAFWRSLNDSAGIILHYPSGQVKRTAEAFEDLESGESGNPLTLVFGPEKK